MAPGVWVGLRGDRAASIGTSSYPAFHNQGQLCSSTASAAQAPRVAARFAGRWQVSRLEFRQTSQYRNVP